MTKKFNNSVKLFWQLFFSSIIFPYSFDLKIYFTSFIISICLFRKHVKMLVQELGLGTFNF